MSTSSSRVWAAVSLFTWTVFAVAVGVVIGLQLLQSGTPPLLALLLATSIANLIGFADGLHRDP